MPKFEITGIDKMLLPGKSHIQISIKLLDYQAPIYSTVWVEPPEELRAQLITWANKAVEDYLNSS